MGILKKLKMKSVRKPVTGLLVVGVSMSLYATEASAALNLSSVNNLLKGVATAITGDFAKAAGAIAVAVTGFTFFTGRINWMQAASIVLGLAVVFGATAIVTSLAP